MKKKRFILSLVVGLGITLLPMQTNAVVLQANPNTNGQASYKPTDWMTYIREMETANQAMGLSEKVDETTKKATSTSNDIDVHMAKTTEWGAMAILSASGYGNSKIIQESDITTTTGNKSGVYIPLIWESTAGGLENEIFSGVDERYYDEYTSSYTSAKTGDGLGKKGTNVPGCARWHGASDTGQWWVAANYTGFFRGGGTMFAFTTSYMFAGNGLGRAAVVCGDGF